MQYLSNILPVDPTAWTLSNATMTKSLIKIGAGGSVHTSLSHEQLTVTPKSFKVFVKFKGSIDEFSPYAFAKLLIKDTNKKYQVFTVPFNATSYGSAYAEVQAELLTNVEDFTDVIFKFTAEEDVEILEWRLYPSAGVDSAVLTTIESMMPQFLFAFNESAISFDSIETEIASIPFAMGKAGNLSCHLLFNYTATAPGKLTVYIKVDGSPEPYAPIVTLVQAGQGFVGIPHSLLQVPAAAHLISVTASIEATDATASGVIPRVTIPIKGMRYTCEGRGILNGASGEYPHAEATENYEYPTIVIGTLQCSCAGSIDLLEDVNFSATEQYIYASQQLANIGCTADIPSSTVKAFGAADTWATNSTNASNISLQGDLSLTSTGLTFASGVGEGIAVCNQMYPTSDYAPLINAIDVSYTGVPNIRLAFSADLATWYTIILSDDGPYWTTIDLTNASMRDNGVTLDDLSLLTSDMFSGLFALLGSTKFAIAIYMQSSASINTFVIKKVSVYYSVDIPEVPLEPPTISLVVPEDRSVRLHVVTAADKPRAIKVYYGDTEQFGNSLVSAVGDTYVEVPNLINRQLYYFAAAMLDYGKESALSNIVTAVPTTPTVHILSCTAGISTIDISWQVIGIVYASYNVYLGTSPDNMSVALNTTDTSITLTNLRNNIEYYVAVTGLTSVDESMPSQVSVVKPMLPVLVLYGIATSKNSIQVSVKLPADQSGFTGFTKYRVYYGTDVSSITEYVESASTTLTIDGLTTGVQYYMYATGLTDTEESTPSEVASAAPAATYTFTSLGFTGSVAPTQQAADAQYTFGVTVENGIQVFKVPDTGTYRIEATGAAGGKGGGAVTNSACLGGFGAIIGGDFELTKDDELMVLVGQKGTDNPQTSGDATTGAGGGMSVVARKIPADSCQINSASVLYSDSINLGSMPQPIVIELVFMPDALSGNTNLICYGNRDLVGGFFFIGFTGSTIRAGSGSYRWVSSYTCSVGTKYKLRAVITNTSMLVQCGVVDDAGLTTVIDVNNTTVSIPLGKTLSLGRGIYRSNWTDFFVGKYYSVVIAGTEYTAETLRINRWLPAQEAGPALQCTAAIRSPNVGWDLFTSSYYVYYIRDESIIFRIYFDTMSLSDSTITLYYNGSTTCPATQYNIDGTFNSNVTLDCTILGTAAPRVFVSTNCQALIDAFTQIGATFSEGFVEPPACKGSATPLIVAGAGNGGGDAAYSGVKGANALLTEGTSDAYLTSDYSGGGFYTARNSSNCGASFVDGGAAATYVYTRSGNNSTPGFGGGGSNQDDGAGGGGGGYRGGVRGSIGGSSFNAGTNPSAVLNTEHTDGRVTIKLLGGNS